MTDPTGIETEDWDLERDDPPEKGIFLNGYVHSDDTGSWTYNDGIWGDNSGGGNDFLEWITIQTIPNNSSINVFTETDSQEHTYIQVGNNVFSNGRYNGSDSPSMGKFGMTGDNVLIRHTGQEAENYVSDRISKYPTTIQKVENLNASKIFSNLNNRYISGSPNKLGSGGVIDGRYGLFSRNCTTCTIDALNAGGGSFDAISPKALPFQIRLHNSGKNPRIYFSDMHAKSIRGPKF